ncbi:MAG: hypothetical protein IJ775_04035 [Muribaculaceae bacterium]|nr:hypothetical protein [Muribaculaceae bacterium]
MKKLLLTFALLGTLAATAAPTADELAGITLGINRWGETSIGNNTISINPSASVEGMWEITNFDRKASYTVKMSIADDGTVTLASQMVGGEYDYDTYEMVYYMLVGAEGINETPMGLAGYPVKGTYADGVITLNDWNIVKVDQNFSENKGTAYKQNVNTMMMAPNTTVAMGIWDEKLNDDWDFLGWNKVDVSEGEKLAGAVQDEYTLHVLNYDEVGSCMTLNLDFDNLTATSPAEQVTFMTTGTTPREYALYNISPVLLSEDDDAIGGPITGTISSDLKSITFENIATLRKDHPSMGWSDHAAPMHKLILTFDEPLVDPVQTGIEAIATDAQVTGVKYVNMAGQMSNRAFEGVNIMITTHADGTTTATKVIR